MSIYIINRSRPGKDPYYKWLEDIKDDIFMLTKQENIIEMKEYPNIKGYSDFNDNELPYVFIEQNIDINKTNYLVSIHEFDLIKAGFGRDRYNIPGQGSESAISFRNKIRMKEVLKDVVSIPEYSKINHVYDVIDFINKFGYPVVIKPVDMAASINVFIIKDDDDLKDLLKKGIQTNWEIEKYIDGKMYHVDGLYGNGKLLLSRTSRYINSCISYQENKFLGSVMLNQDDELHSRLERAVEKILNKVPTPESTIAFHAELFITKENDIVLCEIASRVGGVKVDVAMEYATGVNLVREWVRGQCGINSLDSYSDLGRQGGWIVIPPQIGKLVDINNNFPYKDWTINYEFNSSYIGKNFEGANSSIDKIAELAVKGENEKEIESRIFEINKWFIENTMWVNDN